MRPHHKPVSIVYNSFNDTIYEMIALYARAPSTRLDDSNMYGISVCVQPDEPVAYGVFDDEHGDGHLVGVKFIDNLFDENVLFLLE